MDLSLDQFDGIVSLFLACLELVLILNLLIFAEKNYINKQIIFLVTLLCVYQFLEFIICYFGINSQIILYLALFTITLLPPFSLKIAAGFKGFRGRIVNLVFIPALFFIFYYPTVLDELAVTKCTVFYAIIEFPLGDLYGLFYYTPVILTIVLLYFAYHKSEGVNKRLKLILLLGFAFTFLPTFILLITVEQVSQFIESIMCKAAFILAMSASYVAIMYKEEKKGD